MRRQYTYTGRKKIRLTPFDYFLIVLLLLVLIPAAVTGKLKDGPQLDKQPTAKATETAPVPELSEKVNETLRRISDGNG